MLRQANVEIDEHEAQRIVYTYRNKYPRIAALWNRMGQGLGSILHGSRETLHPIEFNPEGITLPNKLRIKYPALRAQTSKYEYLADARAYRSYKRGEEIAANKWVNIYGGKVTENVIQALARIVITHHMTQVVDQCKSAKVLFQVHDEIVLMAPEAEAEEVKAKVMDIMSEPPAWAEGLPVACEAGYAKSYGDVER
jgi:DNA polymerase